MLNYEDGTQSSLYAALIEAIDPKKHHQRGGKRNIVCTSVLGAYGDSAYWMIVLEGSPPKGAILAHTNRSLPARVLDAQGATRKLPVRYNTTVTELLEQLEKLRDRSNAPRAWCLKADDSLEELLPTTN